MTSPGGQPTHRRGRGSWLPPPRPTIPSEHPSHRPGGDVLWHRQRPTLEFRQGKKPLILEVCPLPPLTNCPTLSGIQGFSQAFANTRIIFCRLACSDTFLKWAQRRREPALEGQLPTGPSQGHPGLAWVYFTVVSCVPEPSSLTESCWNLAGKYYQAPPPPHSTWGLTEPGMSSATFRRLTLGHRILCVALNIRTRL